MIRSQACLDAIKNGEYDEFLKKYYGEERLEWCHARFEEALTAWSTIYGRDRDVSVYSVPYSVLLAGDGADVSIPTNLDLVVVANVNNTNIARVRCSGFEGEDEVDLYQHGPYSEEAGLTISVIRGVQQAFLDKGYKKVLSVDLFVTGDTLPCFGLDEATHFAIAVAKIINDFSFESKLTEKEISEIVQWALANYVRTDSYATDTYSSLRGKTVVGDFTDTENPVIKEIDVDMKGRSMYTVDITGTDLEMHDHEVDDKLDALIAKLDINLDELGETELFEKLPEKEFYEKLAAMGNVDKEAALFMMDYYSQENFGVVYEANAVEGTGSPSVEETRDDEKESAGGAVQWHCTPKFPFTLTVCCVADEAEASFVKAMEAIYGEECVEKLSIADHPTEKIM